MRFSILFFTTSLAFAQLETNTVTVNALRNVSGVPDQVVLGIVLRTDASATLREVVARLEVTGVTPADLVYLSVPQNSAGDSPSLNWSFGLVVPFSRMKDTTATLAQLKGKLGLFHDEPMLVFSPIRDRWSDDAQIQACPLTTLVSDARRQAEGMASAAGMRLGGIVSLSDQTGLPVTQFISPGGGFPPYGNVNGFDDLRAHVVPTARRDCFMQVQFRLLP
jgi:hypothetical protein